MQVMVVGALCRRAVRITHDRFIQPAQAVAAVLTLLTCASMEAKGAEGKSPAGRWILQEDADISLGKACPPKMRTIAPSEQSCLT